MEEEREDPSSSLSDTVCFPSSLSLGTYTSALLTHTQLIVDCFMTQDYSDENMETRSGMTNLDKANVKQH